MKPIIVILREVRVLATGMDGGHTCLAGRTDHPPHGDRAEVYSGRRPQKIGDMFTKFEVHRKAGHWRLVQDSVHDTELVQSYSHIIPARDN